MDEKRNKVSGERVKSVLKEAGIKQRELAEKLHFTPNYINQIVQGKRNLTVPLAEEISALTGVRKEYLLGYDDFKTVKEAVARSKEYLTVADDGVDLYLELIAALRMDLAVRVDKGPSVELFDGIAELKQKSYTFTNNKGETVAEIDGLEMASFKADLMDYAEFILRKIIMRKTGAYSLYPVTDDEQKKKEAE